MERAYWNHGRNVFELRNWAGSMSDAEILNAIDFWESFPINLSRLDRIAIFTADPKTNWTLWITVDRKESCIPFRNSFPRAEKRPARLIEIAHARIDATISQSVFCFPPERRGGQYLCLRMNNKATVAVFGRISVGNTYEKNSMAGASLEVNEDLLCKVHERIETLLAREMASRKINNNSFLKSGLLCRKTSGTYRGRFDRWPKALGQEFVRCSAGEQKSIEHGNLAIKRLRSLAEAGNEKSRVKKRKLEVSNRGRNLKRRQYRKTKAGKKIHDMRELIREYDRLHDSKPGQQARIDEIGRELFFRFEVFGRDANEAQQKAGINLAKANLRYEPKSGIKKKGNKKETKSP